MSWSLVWNLEGLGKQETWIDWVSNEVAKKPKAVTEWLDKSRIDDLKQKYVIKKWDTLSQIAKENGTTMQKIADDNKDTVKDVNKIFEWKTLVIDKNWQTEWKSSKTSSENISTPSSKTLKNPSIPSPKTFATSPVTTSQTIQESSDAFQINTDNMTFDDKYSDWKSELNYVEKTIKTTIDSWLKFTKEQQLKAQEHFGNIETKLQSEKTKLTDNSDILKVDELLNQLKDIRSLYDSNVVNQETDSTQISQKPETIEKTNPDLKERVWNSINWIQEKTALSSWKIDGIWFDEWSQKLKLWENEYKVSLEYKWFSLNLNDVVIDKENVIFQVKTLIWQKEIPLPKEKVIEMMSKLIANGGIDESAWPWKLQITKIA